MIDPESDSIGWKVGAKIGIDKRWCKEGEAGIPAIHQETECPCRLKV
jgi:hypothetical protein